MSTLERGFKTWCERRADALRQEMKIPTEAPIDIFRAAEHVGVKVLKPSDIPGMDHEDLRQLLKLDIGGWSAVTVELTGVTIIVINPAHSNRRIASDLAHEVAHIILEHEGSLSYLVVGEGGMMLRSFDAKREEEANWLGWTLLLPRTALIRAREAGMSNAEIASRYGVSEPLVKFRLQRTGVDLQLGRRPRRRR